jgi:hypothetical protein
MMRPAFSFIIAAVLLQAPESLAAQLDKDSCTKLKNEQAQLERDGARGGLGRGPDWAKANLGPEKMEQIRRLIEVDEQLLFRCGGRPLVVLPNDPDAAPGEGAAGKPERAPGTDKRPADAGKRAIAPVPKATPQPVREIAKEARPAAPSPRAIAPAPGTARIAPASEGPQPAPAPSASTATPAASAATPPPTPAAAAGADEEKLAPALKAAKAKARKKSEDAYRPPPSD